jgi:hypothetical protein
MKPKVAPIRKSRTLAKYRHPNGMVTWEYAGANTASGFELDCLAGIAERPFGMTDEELRTQLKGWGEQ